MTTYLLHALPTAVLSIGGTTPAQASDDDFTWPDVAVGALLVVLFLGLAYIHSKWRD